MAQNIEHKLRWIMELIIADSAGVGSAFCLWSIVGHLQVPQNE